MTDLKTTYSLFNPRLCEFPIQYETQVIDTIDKCMTRLRLQAKYCRYGDKEDELIRDSIGFGTNNSRILEKLINEGENFTINKAITVAQNFEYCQQQMAAMNLSDRKSQNVDAKQRIRQHEPCTLQRKEHIHNHTITVWKM